MDNDAVTNNNDIDALFDLAASTPGASVATPTVTAGPAPKSVAPAPAAESARPAPSCAGSSAEPLSSDDLLDRIGQVTRNLHESLKELGYDKAVDRAADALPDARERLNYIASLTGQAAERTLNCIELAKPIQESMGETATRLQQRWNSVSEQQALPEPLRELIASTKTFLGEVPAQTARTGDHLLEIMMAQDFHDLTGQVIKKVTRLASDVEEQLVTLLRESSELRPKATTVDTALNGPVIDAAGRTDVVTDQEQVDDLLARLGF